MATIEDEPHASEELWYLNIRSPKLPMKEVRVPTLPTSSLRTVVDFVAEVLAGGNLEADFSKLLVKGKRLDLDDAVVNQVPNNATMLLVFSSRQEVEQMHKSAKMDQRIRSIEEEDEIMERKRQASKVSSSYWGEEQDASYKFVKFETVPRFTHPHPFEAERLLIKIATDPGIKHIMKKYKWTVGSLCEMDPKSDMIAKKKEEENGGCVLGYNENAGHKIYLRLRTDDEQEFRGYDGLINTTLHELTHNVRGPHDEEFWKIFAQLKSDYLNFHKNEHRQGNTKAKRGINVKSTVEAAVRSQGGNGALQSSERNAALSSLRNHTQEEASAKRDPIPVRLGAVNSMARRQEREKLAAAAERRFAELDDRSAADCDCNKPAPVKATDLKQKSSSGEENCKVDKKELDLTKQKGLYESNQVDSEQAASAVETGTNQEAKKQDLQFEEPSPLGFDEETTSTRERQVRNSIIGLCRSKNQRSAKLVYLILENLINHTDEKYRTVRSSGSKFQKDIDIHGSELLNAIGFEQDGDFLKLRRNDPGLIILGRSLLVASKLVA